MKMNEENIQFPSMDSWKGSSGKFGLTFKQIVLMHINRCVINGSVEWHGGYWNETGYNPTIRTYVGDSRDIYNNSVKMLRALLRGYFDKDIKLRDKELKEEIDKLTVKYYKETISKKQIYKLRGEIIKFHIELFEELVMLSKRLNFFEEETTEEEQ